jgi:hypothetical protein
MPGNPCAALKRGAHDRIPRVQIDERDHLFYLGGRNNLGINTIESVGAHAPLDVTHFLQIVTKVQHTALNITL